MAEAAEANGVATGADAVLAAMALRISTIERSVSARDERIARVEKELAIDAKATRLEALAAELAAIKKLVKWTLIAVGVAKVLPPDLAGAAAELFKALAGP